MEFFLAACTMENLQKRTNLSRPSPIPPMPTIPSTPSISSREQRQLYARSSSHLSSHLSYDDYDAEEGDNNLSTAKDECSAADGISYDESKGVSDYLLGSLIVRVSSARDVGRLRKRNKKSEAPGPAFGGIKLFGSRLARRTRSVGDIVTITAGSDPSSVKHEEGGRYATMVFGGQTHRTSPSYEGRDGFLKEERVFFDVSLPVPEVAAQRNGGGIGGGGGGIGGIGGVFGKKMGKRMSVLERFAALSTGGSTATNTTQTPDQNPNSSINGEQSVFSTDTTVSMIKPQKPVLTISVQREQIDRRWRPFLSRQFSDEFWSSKDGSPNRKDIPEDTTLATIVMDVTPLITGAVSCIDETHNLTTRSPSPHSTTSTATTVSRCNNNNNIEDKNDSDSEEGHIRIFVEYEPADPPPGPGDIVRFNGFVSPLDVYPIPPSQTFRVLPPSPGTDPSKSVTVSYTSPENWPVTFHVHPYSLLCAVRHRTAVERYQEEVISLVRKLASSPASEAVRETAVKLKEGEVGVLTVGKEAALKAKLLLARWFRGGPELIVGDLIYATNLDGNHTIKFDEDVDLSVALTADDDISIGSGHSGDDGISSLGDPSLGGGGGGGLSGMPCCPLSNRPMVRPVVAADGHTYEKTNIMKWFETNDMSPVTGEIMLHTSLVPNYLLLSTFQDLKGIRQRARNTGSVRR